MSFTLFETKLPLLVSEGTEKKMISFKFIMLPSMHYEQKGAVIIFIKALTLLK